MPRIRFILISIILGLSGFTARAELSDLDCIIEPSDIVDAGSAVRGIIQTINFDRSDVVNKGEVIAKLESDVEKAALKRARINARSNTSIELQKQAYKLLSQNQSRNRPLARMDAISKQEMDQLSTETDIAALRVKLEEHNLALAKTEYERAQASLNRTIIKSPIQGVIVERYKTAGEYVENEPLIRIAKLHPLHVEVLVPTEHFGELKPGMIGQVTPAVASQEPLTAMVERIDRVADAASDTFGVRLRLDNPEYSIPAGVRCVVSFNSLSDLETEHRLLSYKRIEKATKSLIDTESDWVFISLKTAIEKLREFSTPLLSKIGNDESTIEKTVRTKQRKSSNKNPG